MTGEQLAWTLIVGALAAATISGTWARARAWAERARYRAEEAREHRVLAEVEARRAADEARAPFVAHYPAGSPLPTFKYQRTTTAPVPPTEEPTT